MIKKIFNENENWRKIHKLNRNELQIIKDQKQPKSYCKKYSYKCFFCHKENKMKIQRKKTIQKINKPFCLNGIRCVVVNGH